MKDGFCDEGIYMQAHAGPPLNARLNQHCWHLHLMLGKAQKRVSPVLHGLLHLRQLALSFVQHSLTQLDEVLSVHHFYVWVLGCHFFILTQTLPCSGNTPVLCGSYTGGWNCIPMSEMHRTL